MDPRCDGRYQPTVEEHNKLKALENFLINQQKIKIE
jgi:hypothetical protein